MDNKTRLMLAFVGVVSSLASSGAWAFVCMTNGTTDSSVNVDVPIAPPSIKKDTHSNVAIVDMSTYVSCNGNTRDNLRVYSASFNSTLTTYGFTGVLNIGGSRVNMPTSGQYIWPYPNSAATANGTFPIRVTIELRRSSTGAWATGLTLPAGTIIATLVAQQRSDSTWGWNRTWNFVLSEPLVIPSYTCNVVTPTNRTISLPATDRTERFATPKGHFESSKTRFSFNLDCDVLATVDLAISGTKMAGKEDVLVNLEPGNANIGVQIFPADNTTNAIAFDNVEHRMFDSASAEEKLEYDAYYYYDGGVLQGGPIRANATYTFSYK